MIFCILTNLRHQQLVIVPRVDQTRVQYSSMNHQAHGIETFAIPRGLDRELQLLARHNGYGITVESLVEDLSGSIRVSSRLQLIGISIFFKNVGLTVILELNYLLFIIYYYRPRPVRSAL